jgi:hypothetical protein
MMQLAHTEDFIISFSSFAGSICSSGRYNGAGFFSFVLCEGQNLAGCFSHIFC